MTVSFVFSAEKGTYVVSGVHMEAKTVESGGTFGALQAGEGQMSVCNTHVTRVKGVRTMRETMVNLGRQGYRGANEEERDCGMEGRETQI